MIALWLSLAGAPADSLIHELEVVEVQVHTHHNEHENLRPKEIVENLGASLGDLLRDQAGFSNRSMGAAAARPVYRGLGAARLVISENGSAVRDMSATAPDHALAVTPSSSENLVHYTGPDALARFANSSAGIVELRSGQSFASIPEGELRSAFNSNNLGLTNFLSYKKPFEKIQVSTSGLWQKDQNFHTPQGEVLTTDLEQLQFKSGLLGHLDFADLGASFQVLSNNYGIPGGFVGGHAQGVRIQMQRQSSGLDYHQKMGEKQKLDLSLQQSQYGHDELEGKLTSMQFRLQQYAGNITWSNSWNGDSLELRAKVEQMEQRFGGYVLSAPNLSRSLLASVLYKKSLGDFSWALAANSQVRRYQMLNSKMGQDRDFASASFASSVKWNGVGQPLLKYTEMSRIPESDELYNRGPHLAAWSYDQGNQDLPLERGREWELHHDWVLPWGLELSHSIYARDYDAYLMMEPTGKVNTRNGSNLPIWQMRAVAAQFLGAECKIDQKISKAWVHALQSEISYGRQSQNHNPLPLMSPPRASYHLAFTPLHWEYSMDLRGALSQDRLGSFEERTDAYALLDLGIARKWSFESFSINTKFAVDNVLDQVWRNHLSRIKSVYPEKGRELKLSAQVLF